jgi:hypothetical protein
VPEPVDGVRRRAYGRLRSSRPIAGAVAALTAVALSIGVAPIAAGAVVIPNPLGPIDLPLPDPTTTTTVPDPTTTTTTVPETTTTTAAPATTTTTAPRATTTTTRATRRTTTTTAAARGGGAASSGKQSSGPTTPGASTGSSRRVSGTSRAKVRTETPRFRSFAVGPSGATVAPATRGSNANANPNPNVLVPDRLRSAGSPAADPSGNAPGFDGAALAGVLLAAVTALVLALAQRDASRQRREQATLVAPGTLRLGRDESEAGVREQLQLMLAGGALTVTGSDCRSLQLLVQAAAHEGLEIRDPRGYIVRATNRLVRAYGVEPDRKRLPLRWAVGVGTPTVEVPDGYRYVLSRTGPEHEGRLLAFTPGTDMQLWSGDCL